MQVTVAMTPPETFSREHLYQFQVFRDVIIEPIWELLQNCQLSSLSDGEVLLKKNQPNRTMFFILGGS